MTEGAPASAIMASRQARPSSADSVDQFGAHSQDLRGRRSRSSASIFGRRAWLFLVLPALFIAARALYPFAELVRMSLSNVGAEDIIGKWPFVGTAHFHGVASSAGFWQAVKISIVFTAVIVVVDLIIGFVAALWLTQPMRGAGAAQSLMILAWHSPRSLAARLGSSYCSQMGSSTWSLARSALGTSSGWPAAIWLFGA